MTRITEQLWNCAIHALSELRCSNSVFSPWVVKAVQIHPSGKCASLIFLDAFARQKQIGVGLDAGTDAVTENIKFQLQNQLKTLVLADECE